MIEWGPLKVNSSIKATRTLEKTCHNQFFRVLETNKYLVTIRGMFIPKAILEKNSKLCGVFTCPFPRHSPEACGSLENQQPWYYGTCENKQPSKHWTVAEWVWSAPWCFFSIHKELLLLDQSGSFLEKSSSQGLSLFAWCQRGKAFSLGHLSESISCNCLRSSYLSQGYHFGQRVWPKNLKETSDE